MTNQQQNSKSLHVILWVAQVVLAICFIMGTYMKFMPIEKVSVIMPWTGQVSPLMVRLTGLIDFLAAIGLILPAWLRIKPQLTVWAALGSIALMTCAIIFHILRGEASVIGFNIFCIIVAIFIAWGRYKKLPIHVK